MIIKKVPPKKGTREDRVLIECDFKTSKDCKNIYEKNLRCVAKGRAKLEGKDRCINCFNFTKRGKANWNYKFEKNEDFFENIDCELKAYLLGIIAGDGHIKKEGIKIELHQIDIQILILLRDAISSNIRIFKRPDERGKNTLTLDINSTKIKEDLCRHLKLKSHGKKAYDISLPDLPDDLMIHFIRGLCDSDGHIAAIDGHSSAPVSSYCSMSSLIRAQVKDFSEKLGIKTKISGYSVIWNGLNCLAFLDILYKNSQYRLIRKYCTYLLWKTWSPGQGTIIKPSKKRKFDY